LLHRRFTLTSASTGGLFSVALSRGSPRVAVNDHPALWSPDVPRRRGLPTDATAQPTRPSCRGAYPPGRSRGREPEGCGPAHERSTNRSVPRASDQHDDEPPPSSPAEVVTAAPPRVTERLFQLDQATMTAIVDEEWLPLVRLAVLLLGDRPSAEDAVQDACEATWRLAPPVPDRGRRLRPGVLVAFADARRGRRHRGQAGLGVLCRRHPPTALQRRTARRHGRRPARAVPRHGVLGCCPRRPGRGRVRRRAGPRSLTAAPVSPSRARSPPGDRRPRSASPCRPVDAPVPRPGRPTAPPGTGGARSARRRPPRRRR
ncbi:MAG: hypothetical protein JWP68_1860, partial [Modestobacter sp.]|nr:hypothetical protein [Modestobacter sp.]